MIVTKDCYTITDLVLPTDTQNETELVWATIHFKDHSKLMVGPFYRSPYKGVSPVLELENQLSEITVPIGEKQLFLVWVVVLTQGVLTGKLD